MWDFNETDKTKRGKKEPRSSQFGFLWCVGYSSACKESVDGSKFVQEMISAAAELRTGDGFVALNGLSSTDIMTARASGGK